jgi:hypothetical protein
MSDVRFDAFNLDANESVFFKRQLEVVKTGTYDVKFRPNKALSLFPVDTSAGPAATEITWRQYTRVGMAKMVADYAHDFPRVDIYGVEATVKPKGIGASYGYSIEEIRRAQMAGFPLETRRAEAARRAIDDKIDYIAWSGDTATGLAGFINYTGISEYTVISGASGLKTWATKTSDEILKDMNGVTHYVVEATNGVELPDTMLLPMAQYNLIKTKRLGDGSDETVLSYFQKTNQYIKRIEWVVELDGAGGTASDRMMVYVNDAAHLSLELPLPFEQYEYDKKGMEYVVPCYAKTAGMIIYFPASVAFADGI